MWWRVQLQLLALFASAVSAGAGTCQLIGVELCRTTGYNYTGMPNFAGHDTQVDADFTLQTFSPLIQYGCSAQLSFFLCSVYVPMCNEKVATPIGPCRSLCEAVRSRCYPVLQGFGFPWPAALDCAKFPAQNDHEHMCMEGPGEVGLGISVARPLGLPAAEEASCSQYARPAMYIRSNRSGRCLQLCEADVLFSRLDKDVAEVWITVLSSLCFITSLFAVFTFLMDSSSKNSRFPYPERPLPLLALCYNMVSVGWGLRALLGREAVACYPDLKTHTGTLLLAQDGLGNAHCALVFFLNYYFGNAIAVWWVVLTVCWFLCHGLGWSHDRVQPHAPLFHLLGWGVPACLTIAVFVLRYVDADELTGICSVGNHNSESLVTLVVLPQTVCLLLCCVMLLLTATSDRGWYRAIYLLPSGCLVATYWYQYYHQSDWVLAVAPSPSPTIQPRPLLWVFLLRSCTNLVIGAVISFCTCLPRTTAQLSWQSYKKPALALPLPPSGAQYYYKPPVHTVRTHRSHRKHKGKKGGETLV